MITHKKLTQIQQFAVNIDWHIAFNGKTKGNHHLSRVAHTALTIAKKENAKISICLPAAWLHDIGLIQGNHHHPQVGALIADCFLQVIQLPLKQRQAICHCIKSHEGTHQFKSLEAKVVHDADVIDKSGVLGLIRHSWKLLASHHQLTTNQLVGKLTHHLAWRQTRLQTNTGKNIARSIKLKTKSCFKSNKRITSFISTIIPLIKQGLISDQIAKRLINQNQNTVLSKLLSRQLSCDFNDWLKS